jgi:hypothetical protein
VLDSPFLRVREREREENREDCEEAGEYEYFLFSGVRVMALIGNLVREWRLPAINHIYQELYILMLINNQCKTMIKLENVQWSCMN